MSILRSLRRWLGAPADRSGDVADDATDAARIGPSKSSKAEIEIEERRQRAAERLMEDTSLRGDLTDGEFQPLLDWALAETDRRVARTGAPKDVVGDATFDQGQGRIREVVQIAAEAVAAVAQGDPDARDRALRDLPAALAAPELAAKSRAAHHDRLEHVRGALSRHDATDSIEFAHELASALSELAADRSADQDGANGQTA